jgi:hypothetical protein
MSAIIIASTLSSSVCQMSRGKTVLNRYKKQNVRETKSGICFSESNSKRIG